MRKKRTTYRRVLDKLPSKVKKRGAKVMYKYLAAKKVRQERKAPLHLAGTLKI